MFLTQAMGIAATRALQQRTAPVGDTGLGFLAASQVTRHYMGTHGASDMPHDAEEYILPQWREEHQLRIYEAFQRPDRGDAEGVMCAISAFAEAGDVPPPRNNLTSGIKPWTPNVSAGLSRRFLAPSLTARAALPIPPLTAPLPQTL